MEKSMKKLELEDIGNTIEELSFIKWCQYKKSLLEDCVCHHINFEISGNSFRVEDPDLKEELVEHFKTYLTRVIAKKKSTFIKDIREV